MTLEQFVILKRLVNVIVKKRYKAGSGGRLKQIRVEGNRYYDF